MDGSLQAIALTPGYAAIPEFQWTGDGSRLLYSAASGTVRLYSVLADGSAPPLDLGPVYIASWWLTGSGDHVVYRNGALFRVPVDGSAAPVQLSAPALAGGENAQVGLSATHVVYASNEVDAEHYELFSVPLDASAAPIQISHTSSLAIPGTRDFALDPSGTRVVYLTTANVKNDLFSVPIDGSAPAVQLVPPLRARRFLLDFDITPDGASVVYSHDQAAEDRYDLFRVPIDGSAPAVNLTSVPAGAVGSYKLSPDGATLVYFGRTTSGPPLRLWSVRVDGSAAPVVLDPAVISSSPEAYQITPDSSTVLFTEQAPSGRIEVYGIPIDGSAAAYPITDTGASGWLVTPDSQTLVYSALLGTPAAPVLYQAAIHPVVPPATFSFSEPLPATARVQTLALDPTGSQALFVCDALVDNRLELFASPLAGSQRQRRHLLVPTSGASVALRSNRRWR
jgi:Tol biopolymer transport system component